MAKRNPMAELLTGYILGALGSKGDYRAIEADGPNCAGIVEGVKIAAGQRFRITVEEIHAD